MELRNWKRRGEKKFKELQDAEKEWRLEAEQEQADLLKEQENFQKSTIGKYFIRNFGKERGESFRLHWPIYLFAVLAVIILFFVFVNLINLTMNMPEYK